MSIGMQSSHHVCYWFVKTSRRKDDDHDDEEDAVNTVCDCYVICF